MGGVSPVNSQARMRGESHAQANPGLGRARRRACGNAKLCPARDASLCTGPASARRTGGLQLRRREARAGHARRDSQRPARGAGREYRHAWVGIARGFRQDAGARDLSPATGPLPFRAPPPPMAITQRLPIVRVTDPLVGFVPSSRALPFAPPPPPAPVAPRSGRGLLIALVLILLALDVAVFWLLSAHGGR